MENSNAPRQQIIEQERGRQAWQQITAIKALNNKELEKKYRSLARGLNAMIQINGLGQTLGFLCAKSRSKKKDKQREVVEKTEHYYLSEHLTAWMREHFQASNSNKIGTDDKGLLNWVIDEQTTSSDYRRATTECLAFGLWLRRFAEAELEGEDA